MRREPRRSIGSNTNRSAQTAALAAKRQHRIGRSAQATAVAATGRSTGYSIGHSCRKQHWPQRAGHNTGRITGYSAQAAAVTLTGCSTGHYAKATAQAPALATARGPHHRPLHSPHYWPEHEHFI